MIDPNYLVSSWPSTAEVPETRGLRWPISRQEWEEVHLGPVGGFHGHGGTPKGLVSDGTSHFLSMIWGYPYFGKPPDSL